MAHATSTPASKPSSTPAPSASAATTAPAPSSDTPPDAAQLGHAPSVPAGWEKMTVEDRRKLKHLTGSQAVEASALAEELDASTYATDFGPHAPAQGTIVAALQNTGALVLEAPRAVTWSEYVGDMRAVQGDATLSMMDQLAAVADTAVKVNPEIAQTYPLLMAFVQARAAAAAKGVKTRKARAQAKKEQAPPAAPGASASVAPAPVSANAQAAAEPVAPAKPAGS